MSLDRQSNVYAFAMPGGEHASPDSDGDGVESAGSRREEMYAVLSCLEYLYGEAVRVQARMSAHLIGAAAESLRREIAETTRAD